MKRALRLAAISFFASIIFIGLPRGTARAYYTQDLVTNGGFESDPVGAEWLQFPVGGNIGAWTGTVWHGGSRGAKMGSTANPVELVAQDVVVPSDATSVVFEGWYTLDSVETLAGFDRLVMLAYNKNDSTEEFCRITKDPVVSGTAMTWTKLSCEISVARGKTVTIIFGVVNDSLELTVANVDDVRVLIEKPDITAPTSTLSVAPAVPNGSNSFYTTFPVITLAASDDIGGSGASTTNYSWDGASYAAYSSPLTAPEGIHNLNFYSTDVAGNAETVKTTSFKVDTTKPSLALVGSGAVAVEAGSAYTDAGASATDNLDGAIASRIGVANAVNTAKVGTYTVTYNVSDEAGNAAAAVTRTVQVVDSTKPIITMLGGNPVTVEKNSVYTDAGATASDSLDGDISSKITAVSTVNTAAVGDYSVVYSVADINGNATTAERVVKVISKGRVLGEETALPIITNLKQSNNKYSLVTLAGKTVKVQPFDKSYKGKIWAKRVNFGEGTGSLYLFAPLDMYPKSAIMVYGPNGKLIKTVKPFGGFSTSGFNVDIIVEPLNDVVYLAVGTRKAGTTVVAYEASSTGLKSINSVKAGKTSGNVAVKFLSLYTKQYGLATASNGATASLKVWKLDSTQKKYVQDKSYSTKKLKILKGVISKK